MNNAEYKEGFDSQKFNLKKPTKKEMERLLDTLHGLLSDANPKPHLVGTTVAQLQRYFTPNDTAKTTAQDPVKWCLQAVSSEEDRKSIQVAKIIDGCLVAVNGRRMHILSNYTEHADGALLPNGTHISEADYKKEYGTFPNYKQVMPRDPEKRTVPAFEVREGCKGELLYTLDGLPAFISEKFHKQAVAGMDSPEYAQRDILEPMVIVSGNRYAVIMPIRIS